MNVTNITNGRAESALAGQAGSGRSCAMRFITRVDVIRTAFYLGMGSVARRILDGRPSVARVVSRFSGAAMIVLGVLLLAEHLLT